MDTLENLREKIEGAADIESVVKTMKAVAASNIGQYEMAVGSLGEYYRAVTLGLAAYFKAQKIDKKIKEPAPKKSKEDSPACAIVFGSDQGLVGRFNDSLAEFVSQSMVAFKGNIKMWAVGERVQLLLNDQGFKSSTLFSVPGAVNAITPLIGEVLIKVQAGMEKEGIENLFIFHNQPNPGAAYVPVMQRLLPLDEKWRNQFDKLPWPSNKIPQVAGAARLTLSALIREYLFMSLFKACAESLASENSSRLSAMQRAEKNIEELTDDLNNTFHRLRQSSIDEELFDVVSGFEALKGSSKY